jgi:hypothetical protein
MNTAVIDPPFLLFQNTAILSKLFKEEMGFQTEHSLAKSLDVSRAGSYGNAQ